MYKIYNAKRIILKLLEEIRILVDKYHKKII